MKLRFSRGKNRKKAVSSIVGAVIFFGMMLTIASGYFYTITQGQQIYQKYSVEYNNFVMSRNEEKLTLTGTLSGTNLAFNLTNSGLSASIIAYSITPGSGISYYWNATYHPSSFAASNPTLPFGIQAGQTKPFITTLPFVSGTNYTIKAFTARGTVVVGYYPVAIQSQALNALQSGAIGDLYMQFSTYTYYSVITHGSNSKCPAYVSGGTYSGYCIDSSTAQQGFTLPAGTIKSASAFSVLIINYNPSQLTIDLDQFSLLMQLNLHGASGLTPNVWYVISNSSVVSSTTLYPILQTFTVIELPYGQPVLLMYGATNPVCTSQLVTGGCSILGSGGMYTCSGSNCPSSGSTDPTFIVSHGWKGIPITQTANYGQNSPYVTMLYY